jgi:hypothetical protein
MMHPMSIVRFRLTRYRAFGHTVEVELAPITIVIGANHSGKTTLCRAPWFVSQPFARGAASPFAFGDPGGAPAPSLLRVARQGGLSGFEAELGLVRENTSWTVGLHATARVEAGNQPLLARLSIARGDAMLVDERDIEWDAAQRVIRDHDLDDLHEEVGVLGGFRVDGENDYPLQGFMPANVGFRGQDAPAVLASTRKRDVLDEWSKTQLGITYEVVRESSWGSFRVVVDDGRASVLLPDSGTGVVQVLPIAVALLLTPRLPSLYCIEHPELHLHPHAHRAVAELLVQGHLLHPSTRFLVETHSDILILRLRRAIVEKRIAASAVRILYVAPGPDGSAVRPIELNERGVPNWWPKGVFGEAQAEYAEMRRHLREIDLA